jgi:type I restriction enzyme S subunit
MKGTEKTLLVDTNSSEYIFSTGFCAVKAKPSILTDRCLYHLVMSKTFLRQKDQHCTGATQKAITQQGLKKIVLNVPEINKQEQITRQLDTILAAIDIKNQQLSAFDELIEAEFYELFGDPVLNTLGWPKKPLGDECEIITGNTPSRKVKDYYGNYIEWIKSDNINTPSAILTTAEEYLSEKGLAVGRSVDVGAVLMTCIAGSVECIGNIAVADRRVSFNQQINGIVPGKNDTSFLYTMLKLSKAYIQTPIKKALKGILSKGQLSGMEFIFPPVDKQSEFGNRVKQVYNAMKIIEQQIVDLQELLNSKMDEYFG